MRTISDDRGQPKPVTGQANSKAALRALLRAAVMNTGGVPLNGVVIGPPETKAAPRPPQAVTEALNTRASPAPRPMESESGNIPENNSRDPVSISVPSKLVEKIDMPTADEVARAIVAAARETGACPVAIAEGERGNRYHPEVLRCRAYAAIALRSQFEDAHPTSIAHMVGVWTTATAYSYLKTLDEQRARGLLNWWDDAAFMRVVAAIWTDGTSPA